MNSTTTRIESSAASHPLTEGNGSTSQKLNLPRLALLLLLSAVFLYFQLFLFPNIPRVATGDQSIYLHSAARMYEGQLIYKDYDQITFPATDVLYYLLFRIFGVKAWIPQMMLLLCGMLSAWLSVVIASKILRGPAVYLPALLFLLLPYASYPDATHHLYSVLAATAALAVAVEKRTLPRVALAGLFWGLASGFTQSLLMGALGFALFLAWESRRRHTSWADLFRFQSVMWGSYAATLLVLNAYFIDKVGIRDFTYYTEYFVLTYFPTYKPGGWSTYLRGWPSIHKWVNWPDLVAWPLIHALVPFIYIAFFLWYGGRIWRERTGNDRWDRLVLINVIGLSLFLTVASAPAWNRIYTVSMPALIVLVWFVRPERGIENLLRKSLWAVVIVLAIARPLVTQSRWHGILELPTGPTAFFDSSLFAETKWMQQRTRPGDYFFGDQLLCFDLRLKNPTRVAYVTPFAFTTTPEIDNVMQSLEEHQVRFVSWYPGLDDPRAVIGNHLAPLRQYLAAHYRVAQRFGNGHVIWERQSPDLPRAQIQSR